LYGLKQAPK
jgi:hypothetical protein